MCQTKLSALRGIEWRPETRPDGTIAPENARLTHEVALIPLSLTNLVYWYDDIKEDDGAHEAEDASAAVPDNGVEDTKRKAWHFLG